MDDKPTEIVVKDEPAEVEKLDSIYSGLSTKLLQKKVDTMTAQRQVINAFVKDQLKSGTDYGVIDSVSKSGKAFKSKPTLWKPGMEKIFSLFGLVSELEKDSQTLEMLPGVNNLVAFKCNVYKAGTKIAEGRGAAVVGDMGRDANSTIKIAEKRARMDACLTLGFSEFFTQDMDDPEYKNKAGYTPAIDKDISRDTIKIPAGLLATPKQVQAIIHALERRGFKKENQDPILGIKGLSSAKLLTELTRQDASYIISRIYITGNYYPDMPEIDFNDISEDERHDNGE